MADYDGDGRTDLISGSSCCKRPNCFYLFRRQKDGTFGERRRVNLRFPDVSVFFFGANGLRSKIAVADWNGDGVPDVLVGGHARYIGVAFGPLADRDELKVERLWPKDEEPLRVTTNPCVADWDGDGLPDLILGGYRGKFHERKARGVYWFRNVGSKREPKLTEPQRLVAIDNMHRLTGISAADWNGDGRIDLIAARRDYESTGPNNNDRTLRHHRVWVHLRRGS